MANKYIIHGATYNGDGTSSAEATSNGGVGAWNTLTYAEGTTPAYGILAAGDTINIRSKDASGADIVRTMTADRTFGSAAATETAPITWIVDDGATWPGISGVINYQNSGGNYSLNIVSYNNVIALSANGLKITTANAWGSNWTPLNVGQGGYAKNIEIDGAAWSLSSHVRVILAGGILENLKFTLGRNETTMPMFLGEEYASSFNTLINPEIIVNGAYVGAPIATAATYGGSSDFLIIGGSISGTAADAGMPLCAPVSTGRVRFVGTLIPRSMKTSTGPTAKTYSLEVVGCDADGTGGYLEEYWGWATSRTDNYPPTLSATLPDSGLTPWALRVYPRNATVTTPMRLVSSNLFTDTAAAKTITLETLIATTMSPTKKSMWMTVEYIDNATGLPKHLNTRDFSDSALDASTANWSATTWGMVAFNKRKFSVTTPTAIKPGTLITVTLFGTVKSATENDILFVDPFFGVN